MILELSEQEMSLLATCPGEYIELVRKGLCMWHEREKVIETHLKPLAGKIQDAIDAERR